ncbi:hypothetical protein ColLi_06017 [Colletotrichum liriopes]|uniref:Uncharacterized protein n=1 Tax=Colletotrichum liriopes TaxID=708192 RepID=A0AA37GM23_9PEZI|nr:hypothetical protein ColLi_06017 [Colletotrichum liriopes]
MPSLPTLPHVPSTASFIAEARQNSIKETAFSTPRSKSDLLTSIRSFAFQFIKEAAHRPPREHELSRQGLEVLWHMFTDLAKTPDPDDAFQDRLVSLLLWTREFDGLYKRLQGIEGVDNGWESYGFGRVLQASWEQVVATGPLEEKCRLASFSSKVLSAGACRDSLGQTALWLLREALATTDEERTSSLLPAAIIWLENARHSLFVFSAINGSHEDSPHATAGHSSPGALAQVAGVEDHGLALERWLFWRRRLQQLSRSSDTDLAKQAKKGFMSMIFCGRDMGFEVEGEARFSERLQKAMHEELMRSGKNSVDGDEIEIDVDWAI